jgi:hypothetical protein
VQQDLRHIKPSKLSTNQVSSALRKGLYFSLGYSLLFGITFSMAFNTNVIISQIPLLLCIALFIVNGMMLAYLLRDCNDTLNLRNELQLGLLAGLATLVSYVTANLAFKDRTNIFQYAQFYTSVGNTFLAAIACFSPFVGTKDQTKRAKYDVESFVEVLRNPARYEDLKKAIARELSTENALFYESIAKLFTHCNIPLLFQGKYPLIPIESAANSKNIEASDMRVIYKQFIASNSPNELNISDNLRQEFIDMVQKESPSAEILLRVNDQVLESIYSNAYFKYCNTNVNKGNQV